MSGCPICGVEAEIHDRVYVGQQCNLRKPLFRIWIEIRNELVRVVASLGLLR